MQSTSRLVVELKALKFVSVLSIALAVVALIYRVLINGRMEQNLYLSDAEYAFLFVGLISLFIFPISLILIRLVKDKMKLQGQTIEKLELAKKSARNAVIVVGIVTILFMIVLFSSGYILLLNPIFAFLGISSILVLFKSISDYFYIRGLIKVM